jgi:GNAT superfamily N-acetyltransferase
VDYSIRKANFKDRDAIQRLIEESARGLSLEDYSGEQIEAALLDVFGVDTNLILDATYYVADSSGTLLGCGGWSKRRTLFGGDQYAARDASELDPQFEPARIRAFFVHPACARRGIGRAILETCEQEAKAHGFRALELMATLPGVKLYEACGYETGERVEHLMKGGVKIEFISMRKALC